jgi:hypothetical protein
LGQAARIDGSFDKKRIRATIDAPFIDFDRAARFAGVDSERLGGTITAKIVADIGGKSDSLQADLDMQKVRMTNVPRLDGRAHLDLQGRKLEGAIDVTANKIGHVDLSLQANLAGPARRPSSFTGATGTLTIKTSALSVEAACRRFDCPTSLAAMELLAQIDTKIERTDRQLTVDFDGSLADPKGPLAQLEFDGRFDPDDFFVRHRLPLDAPFQTKFALTRRRIEDLPVAVRPAGIHGSIEAHGDLRGTLREPELTFGLTGDGFQSDTAKTEPPLDFNGSIEYRGTQAETTWKVTAHDEQVLRAHAIIEGAVNQFWEGRSPRWKAALDLDAIELPLGSLAALAHTPASGELSG